MSVEVLFKCFWCEEALPTGLEFTHLFTQCALCQQVVCFPCVEVVSGDYFCCLCAEESHKNLQLLEDAEEEEEEEESEDPELEVPPLSPVAGVLSLSPAKKARREAKEGDCPKKQGQEAERHKEGSGERAC